MLADMLSKFKQCGGGPGVLLNIEQLGAVKAQPRQGRHHFSQFGCDLRYIMRMYPNAISQLGMPIPEGGAVDDELTAIAFPLL